MAAKQATPTTSKDDVEDEPVFKTAHNNPEEAKKILKSIMTLVDKFMADITGYDRYKQMEGYTKFFCKYVKELKHFDDYFKDTSPSIILEITDDKISEYIIKPPPALGNAGQAAVVQSFANLQFAHEYSAKVAKAVVQLGTVTTPSQFYFIMRRAV